MRGAEDALRGSRVAAPIRAVIAAGASVIGMARMGALRAASTAAATAGMAGMGAVSLYASIDITASERGYGLALVVLLLASVLSAWSGRRRGGLRHP